MARRPPSPALFPYPTLSRCQASDPAKANTIPAPSPVPATATGVAPPASFTLTNTAGAATSIVVSSGSGQSATVNTLFTNPLVVTVLDQFNNLVPNVNVTFAAPGTGASVSFPGGATVATGSNGQASDAVF